MYNILTHTDFLQGIINTPSYNNSKYNSVTINKRSKDKLDIRNIEGNSKIKD